MAKNYTVSPSTSGVRASMQKMYDGRNVATRPIPVIVDTSEARAIMSAAADSRPKTSAVNMPSGKRIAGAEAIYGTPVAAPGNVARGAAWNPLTGTENFE
jgi:hypothetical protein